MISRALRCNFVSIKLIFNNNHTVRFGETPDIVLSKYRQFRLGRFGRDNPKRTY